jgi:hypothetical protein
MKKRSRFPILLAVALTLFLGQSALAQDEWKFGIGTGFSSLALDGDIGFASGGGGVLFKVDLDNSDTSDLFKSGFGAAGFAAKGKWRINYSAGRLTLEDDDGGLDAEWDRDQVEVTGVYSFAKTGSHAWGALFGVRYIGHEWQFTTALESVEMDDSWTDGLVGITHAFPFTEKLTWANRLDAGFGGSEGTTQFITGLNWMVARHWVLNFNIRATAIEFGDEDDIDDSDFYLYDVDETAVGIGFMYMF